jgi:thioredoxin 1
MAERLNKDNFQEKAEQRAGLALIDFYSDSCIPCKRIAPVLAELEEEYEGALYVGKVNVNYEADLVAQYGVMAAPTLILLKDGKQVKKLTGAVKKEDLKAAIEENR